MNICNVCDFPVRPRQEGLQWKAVSDGNIVPAVLEYPEPSTAPLYSLERELTGVAGCVWRHHALRALEWMKIWTL